jgi:hypothetical protein
MVASIVVALLLSCGLTAWAKDKAKKAAADDDQPSSSSASTDSKDAAAASDSKDDAPDPDKSGPQVGDELGPFDVEKLAGAGNDNVSVGQHLCYRCMLGDRPVVMIFTSDLDLPLADLITTVDKKVHDKASKKLASFIVLLNGDNDILKIAAEQMVEQLKVQNVAIVKSLEDNANGPKSYKLNPKFATTVLVYKDGKVAANYAIERGQIDKKVISSIMASTDKMLKAK